MMPKIDQRALSCASNNADIYEAVFTVHGLGYRRERHAFVGLEQPPPYYSNLTTLLPDETERQLSEIRSLTRQFPGSAGLKDAFSKLDLTDVGFRILFKAHWLWLDADRVPTGPISGWQRIETPRALAQWERAWKRWGSPTHHRMFPDKMLDMAEIAFFGLGDNGNFVAGCIGSVSDDSVGLSNVFAEDLSSLTFQVSTQLVAGLSKKKPIVGCDKGASLRMMEGLGFEKVGRLRVWVMDNAAR